MAKVTVTASDRRKLADFAMQIARAGGHFLNGTQGAMPGFSDGPLDRHVMARPLRFSPSAPMLQAAGFGESTCMGRHLVTGGHAMVSSADLKALALYLHEQESIFVLGGSETDLQPFDRRKGTTGLLHSLFPRKVGSQIILGERCLGKRHFDCIGFVNFCLSKVMSPKWNRSFGQYKRDFGPVPAAALQPGDIVIRIKDEIGPDGKPAPTNHAGICVQSAGKTLILNCAAGSQGLIMSAYSTVRWPHRRRINAFG